MGLNKTTKFRGSLRRASDWPSPLPWSGAPCCELQCLLHAFNSSTVSRSFVLKLDVFMQPGRKASELAHYHFITLTGKYQRRQKPEQGIREKEGEGSVADTFCFSISPRVTPWRCCLWKRAPQAGRDPQMSPSSLHRLPQQCPVLCRATPTKALPSQC